LRNPSNICCISVSLSIGYPVLYTGIGNPNTPIALEFNARIDRLNSRQDSRLSDALDQTHPQDAATRGISALISGTDAISGTDI